MKRTISVVLCLVAVVIVAIWLGKQGSSEPVITPSNVATATAEHESQENDSNPPPSNLLGTTERQPTTPRTKSALAPIAVAETAPDEADQIRRSVDQLVSPQTSMEQKYATWIRLRDENKLNQVIAELEQRATNNPASAEFPAALGQAYLHKITASKDPRDYPVLGSMADRSFDTALDIDPANWEARFFKAMAMSYWPEEMNKRPEVIQRFTRLIEDQETQPSQPQHAQSYYWLGETYLKGGRPDYAEQVWRRGAALFPSDPMLQQKLSGQRSSN